MVDALTIEDITQLMGGYERYIKLAFDVFTKMMSPYTKWLSNYLKKMKRGEVPELPP